MGLSKLKQSTKYTETMQKSKPHYKMKKNINMQSDVDMD